jgi:ABC-2 type transport system ATP-binding protein
VLEVADLSRRFGHVVALDGLSFTIEPGQLCGFLGPNGAGKTTAMRCIVGVTEPDAGEVHWGGRPMASIGTGLVGYMPEERGLYPRMPVVEQLVYLARLHGMPAEEAEPSARRWVERLGVADRADDPVETLSLGNQQRVQLAAALVHDPQLLVLDEPFSGLDPIAVDVMSDVLRERAAAGTAVIFSSHQLDLVEGLCRSVVVVDHGRLVLDGEVTTLRRQGERRLRLAVDGGTAWAEDLPDWCHVDRIAGDEVTLRLSADADPGALIDLARRQGELRGVHLDEPRLSELFRDAVGRPVDDPSEPSPAEAAAGGSAR